jgi:hypothetical protein
MGIRTAFARVAVALSAILACATASAIPVTLDFHGSVTSHDYIDLSAGLPVGAHVDLSLTFNETFSDHTYSFTDDLGPVSGTMTVGSAHYVFNGYNPYSYSYNIPAGDVKWVEPMFLGTGPLIGTGELFGLFALFTPELTLVDDLLLGYGFTTDYGDGASSTAYGYARLTADRYSITPAVTPVPEPATLLLLTAGLLGAAAIRRRV